MNQVSAEPHIPTMSIIWISTTICLTIALIAGIWRYAHHITHRQSLPTNVFTTPGRYHLPDQSTVVLKPNSQLTYSYTIHSRHITLTGEADFHVNDDPNRPFYVHTEKMLTKVLDTSF